MTSASGLGLVKQWVVLNMVMNTMMMMKMKMSELKRKYLGGLSWQRKRWAWTRWSWFLSQKSPSDISEEASVLEVDQVHVRVQHCSDAEGLSSAGLEQSSGRNTS